jgi:Notch-like protein
MCQTQPWPCATHGAVACKNTDIPPGYTCKCRPGFTGVHCDVDVNECARTPFNTSDMCNGVGACVNTIGGYVCMWVSDALNPVNTETQSRCTPSFMGVNCTTRFDVCAVTGGASLCMHGGNCSIVDVGDGYKCACPPGGCS